MLAANMLRRPEHETRCGGIQYLSRRDTHAQVTGQFRPFILSAAITMQRTAIGRYKVVSLKDLLYDVH